MDTFLTAIWSAILLLIPLVIPTIREAVVKYIAGFVQSAFDAKIEKLRSELRQAEEQFASELRTNEQQLRSLADATLVLRSNRQAALDSRRLRAVEKLWETKIAIDRLKPIAASVSVLNLDEVFKAAESGDTKIKEFARTVINSFQIDLSNSNLIPSAETERPYLPPNLWGFYSAYHDVLVRSVAILQALAHETTKYLKKEDTLKPLMLLALPEYKSYIEQYGFSGYYHLLDALEQKLLTAISEFLDGRELDDAALKRAAEIWSTVRLSRAEIRTDIPDSTDLPESMKRGEIPQPPKK